MAILVTGGAGFIGSHAVVELINAGYELVIIDNYSNSSPRVLTRIEQITAKLPMMIEGDIRNRALLDDVFKQHSIDAVVHFAGLKAVGESVFNPLDYYDNNVNGSLVLFEAMKVAGVKRLVFSSSATVYGDPAEIPISENCPLGIPTNPYGMSKSMVERILQDLVIADPDWSVALLRYFNPIGAHPSGLIGEDPAGVPNNLLPYVTQVAIGKLPKLFVFGKDYPTVDGTGVRDYIHVVDLAKGHLAALDYLRGIQGCHVWNLGTGEGYSVLQIVQAFEVATGTKVPYELVDRRDGDIAECWSNPQKAKDELAWQAEYDLDDMMRDSWNWQSNNPHGYRD
ncbi:UDP-glucose 4-epimerase GalE [Oligella urethralis]|uniref:UDP-glucose 4-epimerase GalE n=1 Tax=Oligella urethralis TaxID=90245 RepID=UPI000E057F6D|nr:UDP-glucose 4-epimerase GalE [Oligella urethralis]SUA57988.1 UDP-glucose 4-epimerase [Oligella urethralis]